MEQLQEGFLSQIANSLYQIHGQHISELTIVFPNRRAGIFFMEYLNRIISAPTFSPEIITIQELFSNISSLHTEDELQLIFRLFKIYKDLSGSKESFDEFYLWGEMLLHDFDQVDKYLVDAELLFTNITDLKEIDEHFNDWNDERKEEIKHFWKSLTSGDQKTDQKEFARLWQVLYPIYQKFKEELFKENIAFEGMLFRDAVENGNSMSANYLANRKFVIAGFNALNGCEKMLFKALQEGQNINFYWDFDLYYLNDPYQEAALFMRENLKMFPQEHFPYNTNCFKQKKKFQIIHTSSQIGQAQIAAREINLKGKEISGFDDTAIVLCDEELLLPVLSAIPTEIETVNVTMGLPLKQTPLFSLVSQLIILQKKSKKEDSRLLFHYKSVVDILNNQLIQTLYPIESKLIAENIIQNNLLYIAEKELGTTDLFCKVFTGRELVSEYPEYFLTVLYDIFVFWDINAEHSFSQNYQEYLYQAYVSINKLNNILFSDGLRIMGSKDYLSKETFFKLLLQYLGTLSVTFEGEPLAGLQIMGILETRTLDFKNVILLSVNEGIMPKANVAGSFIPYHLRKGVGLPTVEEQNAMYAYYFYRLLQRAEHITFIYNSGANGLKTGEKSRFLYQLLLESSFEINERGVENTIDPLPVFPIVIEKKGKVLDVLNQFIESGRKISPTALDQYIQCPLSYYFKYIVRFEEEDEITEEVDARMFGKLFHTVMEVLYQPFIGKDVNESILVSLIQNEKLISTKLTEAFVIHFFKSKDSDSESVIAGRNTLVYEVIKKMVIQTLKVDLLKVPFKIEGLEHKVEANIPIFQNTKVIRIGGIIDRIDLISSSLEIIDYKTGATEHSVNSLEELFDPQNIKRNKAAFQTLVYGLIWDKMYPGTSKIYPAIYALKRIFIQESNRLTLKDQGNETINYQDIKNEFEPRLIALLEDLFNPDIPFRQTIVVEHCKYCNFATICGKSTSQS